MADSFIGEVRILGCTFAPDQWAQCNGQTMPVGQNQALFALIGNIYGGQAPTTFGLPNMQGRAPVGAGAGPDLTPRTLGESDGAAGVSLSVSQLPSHSHNMNAAIATGVLDGPMPGPLAYLSRQLDETTSSPTALNTYTTATSPIAQLAPATISSFGVAGNHENRQPYLAINFCISLAGMFPPFQ
jgi:microcystin-dependent protein